MPDFYEDFEVLVCVQQALNPLSQLLRPVTSFFIFFTFWKKGLKVAHNRHRFVSDKLTDASAKKMFRAGEQGLCLLRAAPDHTSEVPLCLPRVTVKPAGPGK